MFQLIIIQDKKEKIIIDKKNNINLNQNESNSVYKITKVKYSYLKCDGFIINDTRYLINY